MFSFKKEVKEDLSKKVSISRCLTLGEVSCMEGGKKKIASIKILGGNNLSLFED